MSLHKHLRIAVNWIVIHFAALLALSVSCTGSNLGSDSKLIPYVIVKLPADAPQVDYDVLVRFADHHGNIYGKATGAENKLVNNEFRVDFLTGERGLATITAYAKTAGSCAEYSGTVSIDIEDDIRYQAEITSSLTKHSPPTCLLIVTHKLMGTNQDAGTVTSTIMDSAGQPLIRCGHECYAHVERGASVDLHAMEDQTSSFATWSFGNSTETKPDVTVTVMDPVTVNAIFTPLVCQPGGFCKSNVEFDASIDRDSVTLRSVWGTTTGNQVEVWAAGSDIKNASVVLHYDDTGNRWQQLKFPGAQKQLFDIWSGAAGAAWAVGGMNAIYSCQWPAGTCVAASPSPAGLDPGSTFQSIGGSGNTVWLGDAFGVAYVSTNSTKTTLGSFTKIYEDPSFQQQLTQVVAIDSGLAYAATGSPDVLKAGNLLANTRIQQGVMGESFRAVGAVSASAVWAAGDKGVLRRSSDSVNWSLIRATSDLAPAIRRLFATSAGRIWAVGDSGYIEYWQDGASRTGVQNISTANGQAYYGVWSNGAHTWIVGQKGTILHYYQPN